MPTLHREAGYTFRFRANDRGEPPHVHIEGNDGRAKYWLSDLRAVRVRGYNRQKLAEIERILAANADDWIRRWHEYFD